MDADSGLCVVVLQTVNESDRQYPTRSRAVCVSLVVSVRSATWKQKEKKTMLFGRHCRGKHVKMGSSRDIHDFVALYGEEGRGSI